MSSTAIDAARKTIWTWGSAALVAACLAVSSAAAESPSLAAPGDCAQPIRDFETGPITPSVSSGGVAGPPAFSPVATTQDVVARLPLDLTGITLQVTTTTSSASTGLLSSIGAALGLVDSSSSTTLQTAGDAVGAVGDAATTLVGSATSAGTPVVGNATDAGNTLVNGATDGTLLNGAGDATGTLVNGTSDATTTLLSGTNDATTTLLGGATDTGTNLVQDAGSLLQNTTSTVTGATGGLLK